MTFKSEFRVQIKPTFLKHDSGHLILVICHRASQALASLSQANNLQAVASELTDTHERGNNNSQGIHGNEDILQKINAK